MYLEKTLDIHKSYIFFIICQEICILGYYSRIKKKAGQTARQIWKIPRDKINLTDFRKGTLKKMQWEAT